MFMPCMVGTLESQFLKMMCQIKNANKCLDIGTFTGMSALAMAEGMGHLGSVITLENDEKIARVAQQGFNESDVGNKIKMIVGSADEEMKQMQARREKFDIIFIDADKEAYLRDMESVTVAGALAKAFNDKHAPPAASRARWPMGSTARVTDERPCGTNMRAR